MVDSSLLAAPPVASTAEDRIDRLLGQVGALQADVAAVLDGQRLAELSGTIATLKADLARVSQQVGEIRQLVGPFAATFPDGSMLCQTIHGVKYYIDPDDLIIAPQMVIYRQWEAQLSDLFRRLCGPDTVVVDVGANFGYFTCLAGTMIGNSGQGRIFAFEPNPKLVSLLRRNADINWSMAPISIYPVAVADVAGTARLSIPSERGANGTLSSLGDDDGATIVEVETVRLDDVLPPDLAVDLLKVDVEGHELKVLQGARAVIARSPQIKIVMEWSVPQMRDAGIDPLEVADLIEGFTCYDTEAGGNPFDHPRDRAWLLAQGYANVLLTKD